MKKLLPLLALLFIYLLIASRVHGQNAPSLPGLNTDSLKAAAGKQKKEMAALMSQSKLDAMVIRVEGGRFGYYVFVDGKLTIEQKTIPGLVGNKGFANETDAKKVAELVIHKLKEGEMPPNISGEDLKRLKITIVP